MCKNLKNRLKSQKGFTLMEMLVVVAIIVILIAVSIPTFSGQMNKAKEATDAANERAAKAAALTAYLTDGTTGTQYYNAADGKLYGSVTTGYGKSDTNKDKCIKITIDSNGMVTNLTWETGAGAGGAGGGAGGGT